MPSSTDRGFMVETHKLVKRYPNTEEAAVNGIDLNIRRGEIFSLLGPNGAGKTTIISMLCGLLKPTSGEAFVNGYSIDQELLDVKRSLGFVPQDIALYPTLTAHENLRFWGQMYGLGGGHLKERIYAVLEIVGLQDRANDRIESYSGGMKRRINIAVGLLHEPGLIFMDEPTVGIDPQSRRSILDTVMKLNQQGMTVLYTTHYMEEAQEISDRIGIIDHGAFIAIGTLAELTQLVGEHDIITLALSSHHSPPALQQALERIDGVLAVNPENGFIRLLAEDGNASLPAMVAAANHLGIKITDVAIKEPNLEAVFLHLTGRSLRD